MNKNIFTECRNEKITKKKPQNLRKDSISKFMR